MRRHVAISCVTDTPAKPLIVRQPGVYPCSPVPSTDYFALFIFATLYTPPSHTFSHSTWAGGNYKKTCLIGCSIAAAQFWGGDSCHIMAEILFQHGVSECAL